VWAGMKMEQRVCDRLLAFTMGMVVSCDGSTLIPISTGLLKNGGCKKETRNHQKSTFNQNNKSAMKK
jgi:hypothetical protein